VVRSSEEVEMGNPVVHFEIVGKDGAALVEYYEQLFGWKTQGVEEMGYWLAEREEGGIAGGIGTSEDSSHVTFYVGVDDPQAALDRAVELGGAVVMPVTTIPDMVTFALFADPEGHVVGVVANGTSPG
jgi:predicted enzyme related to lactoylglutathione lyase